MDLLGVPFWECGLCHVLGEIKGLQAGAGALATSGNSFYNQVLHEQVPFPRPHPVGPGSAPYRAQPHAGARAR